MSGVAITRSGSVKPPWIRSTRSSAPTIGGGGGFGARRPRGGGDATSRPVPDGRATTTDLLGVARVGTRVDGIPCSSNLALALALTA
jgi:hypothetical protein